ncbi:bifunctional adenosylcobinamide kinase/adenosylcobinamide-phosphate guanylyltransferase [Corynebacterium epidermidicanis]|uniref:Adenosylcobinamide kinase n=1 Tax=Corynebacterium epidermidicanis TaxID=1050174 RepID=A0A0G3GQS3_9CORY|nr:bifunctional adenosylcobinamide kinase/adenosylcobinamide-phosphate guanylyltransferase [Corynebacterium epidermidicanis]AKK03556.1 adenosylcobinamide-phosphate guanylyltransferase; adenosylcobinamide kinase [Corynebacterium epidermidicanis]
MITLVLGGARSGKSAFAEMLTTRISSLESSAVTYVATARPWPGDTDFAQRIAKHQASRPAQWHTEDCRDAIDVLCSPQSPTLIIDDLGTWLSEQFDSHDAWPDATAGKKEDQLRDVERRCAEFVAALQATTARNVVMVTPEVGMGLIPETPVGRVFRDTIGALNAAVAECADQVHLVVAGCALTLKPE